MGHYYDKHGNPKYEVPYANGKGTRETTLRDAKKLKLLPSVTTITQVIATTGLDAWKQRQTLEAAFDLKKFDFEHGKAHWIREVTERATKISRDTSEKGTIIHNALETTIKTGLCGTNDQYYSLIMPVLQALEQECPRLKWRAELSFAHPLGFAGKIDLMSEDGSIILDFKTKDSDDFEKELAYDNHIIQLGAYRILANKPQAALKNLFISTKKEGLIKFKHWTKEESQRGEKMFLTAFEYWKLSNNYDPALELEGICLK